MKVISRHDASVVELYKLDKIDAEVVMWVYKNCQEELYVYLEYVKEIYEQNKVWIDVDRLYGEVVKGVRG